MMNPNNGWMGGWANGGGAIWPVIGVVVVVLLIVVVVLQVIVIIKQSKK